MPGLSLHPIASPPPMRSLCGFVTPDCDVTVTVRMGGGLHTSAFCKHIAESLVKAPSWSSDLRDTSHGAGAVRGAGIDIG